jgi:methylase of polypeptide subunit release factors
MKHFLTKAVELLHPQPIYYTPTKVKQYVNKHKFDFLIQNPPYAVNNK